MPYLTIDSSADFSTSEIWDECTSDEKMRFVEYATEEGFINRSEKYNPSSYTEQEIARLLVDIWENKHHMQISDLDEIRASLREKNIL